MQIDYDTPAIVCGGGSGLGAATARLLAFNDAPVAILDIDAERAAAVADEVDGVYAEADVTDDTSVRAALEKVREYQGQERICVNCAGIPAGGLVVGRDGPHDMEVFERTLAVNLAGTMRVMSQSAAGMVKMEPDSRGERGVIVNTASIAAMDGQVGQAAYAASKGGVVSLTLPAARELARWRVRVIALAPGVFDTPLVESLPDTVRDSLSAQVPNPPRLGHPAEYAMLVCSIIENAYINGETIRIDGALRMAPR